MSNRLSRSLLVSGLVLGFALVGCSSDDAAPVDPPVVEQPAPSQPVVEEPAPSQPVVEEPAPSQPVVEEPVVEEPAPVAQAVSRAPGNSVAWAPGQDAVTIQVGQFVDITAGDPLSTVVSSSDPRALKAFPGKQEEGKVLYPAAKGISPGAATLTVTLPDGTVSNVSVTVNGR